MQPQNPRSTNRVIRSTVQNRDVALNEVRSQIDDLYNTDSSSNHPTIQPIISSTPAGKTAIQPIRQATNSRLSTFTVPSAKPGQRPAVRRSLSGISNNHHTHPAYQPAAQTQIQPSRISTASTKQSTPTHHIGQSNKTAGGTTPPANIQPHHNVVTQPRPTPTPQSFEQTASSSRAAQSLRSSPPQNANTNREDLTNSSDQALAGGQASPGAPRQPTASQKAAWQQYHSAWQNYYQQYYERYYLGQIKKAQDNLAQQANRANNGGTTNSDPANTSAELSKAEALTDLRASLLNKIRSGAGKVRRSRHFIPAMAALVVMAAFLVLQYNRVFFSYVAAYTSPSTLDAQSYIISPYDTTNVGPESKLIIPKIAVDVPIVWDANAASQASLNAAMNNGVVWFNIPGANAKPGEVGNFVVSGHSSNDWLDSGKYKFIFARLEQLQKGDNVYVNYNGTRYTYTVTGSQVVKPTDVQALQTNATKPTMTLITCVPLGTDLNRLLVTAEQTNPDPSTSKKSNTTQSQNATNSSSAAMPGNSPTFLQRIGNLFSGSGS